MTTLLFLKSLFLGAGAGALYGLSLLGHRNLVFKTSSNFLPSRKFFLFFVSSFMRLGLLAVLCLYVLRTPSLNIILVLASFFGGFWLAVLQKKVRSHEH
jgi:hypothetical protein